MDCRKVSGFTLLELLTTVAIGAIMLLVAAPAFTDLVRSSRLSAQTHLFISAVNYARTEAIQRKGAVWLCVGNGVSCQIGRSWEQGWLIFVDKNRNTLLDDGELIQAFDALESGYTLRSNVRATNLVFRGNGEMRRTSGALPLMTFRLCAPDAGNGNLLERSREIVINSTGRMRLQFGREIAGAC